MLGLNSQSINNMDFPVDSVRNRPLNLSAYENPFHSRAKQGFEYWTKDKRNPENNKNKGKLLNLFIRSFQKITKKIKKRN